MTNAAIHGRGGTGGVRILGLDPGLRHTGWGVVVSEGSRLRWIAHGVVKPDERAPFSERLLHLLEAVGQAVIAGDVDPEVVRNFLQAKLSA